MENPDYLITDIDGTLTDGKIILSPNGEIKSFSVRDGWAIKELIKLGIKVIMLTGRSSHANDMRARELGCPIYQGISDKGSWLKTNCKGKIWSVGDDIQDVEMFKISSMSFAPRDAHFSARSAATRILTTKGGEGVIREIYELVVPFVWQDDFYLEMNNIGIDF